MGRRGVNGPGARRFASSFLGNVFWWNTFPSTKSLAFVFLG
jgi:hypothetical protein